MRVKRAASRLQRQLPQWYLQEGWSSLSAEQQSLSEKDSLVVARKHLLLQALANTVFQLAVTLCRTELKISLISVAAIW